MGIVEAAALLHDIGLPYVNVENERSEHGPAGAEVAEKFLRENSNFTEEQIEQITTAVRYHGSPPKLVADLLRNIGEKGRLVEIVRDADMLDSLGAVGLMRAFISKSGLPDYNEMNVKSDTWGLSSRGFDEKFAQGLGIGDTIIDQINFHISYFDNLHTETGRLLAKPLVEFMKNFLIQLENQINNR